MLTSALTRRWLMDAYNESDAVESGVSWLNWLITCVGTGVVFSNRRKHASSLIGLKFDVYSSDLWLSCQMQLHRTYVSVYQHFHSNVYCDWIATARLCDDDILHVYHWQKDEESLKRQRLDEVVDDHVFCEHIFEIDATLFNRIANSMKTHVDMFRSTMKFEILC